MPKEDAIIRVNNASKTFKPPHERAVTIKSIFTGKSKIDKKTESEAALRDISFEVKKGEFFGIVGRNGSGKSTLLKILAGIYQPTKGSTEVKGRLVPFIELGVGFNPELSGRENVYLNGALLNFSRQEIDNFYDEVVEFAELEGFMDQKLKNYSSGMQVRLAFSMAIRADADILLIDEVLAVGDADFQRKCYEYFKKLKKNNKTVVFVSHDMEAVRQYCNRAILIEDSRIIKIGSAEKIATAYIRQFNQPEDDQHDSKNQPKDTEKRWGNGAATLEKIEIKTSEDKTKINLLIKAHTNIDDCIVGIRIKASSGTHVTGTNTKIERQKIKKLTIGQKALISLEVPNILSDGTYLLDAAITQSDEITVIDWLEDAKSFTIKKNRRLPYFVDPGFKVEVTYL